jgi:hypothetical protein
MLGRLDPEALPEILPHTHATALLLFKDADPLPAQFMPRLALLAKRSSVPLFLGGRLTDQERKKIPESGAIPLSETLSEAVNEFQASLTGEPFR